MVFFHCHHKPSPSNFPNLRHCQNCILGSLARTGSCSSNAAPSMPFISGWEASDNLRYLGWLIVYSGVETRA